MPPLSSPHSLDLLANAPAVADATVARRTLAVTGAYFVVAFVFPLLMRLLPGSPVPVEESNNPDPAKPSDPGDAPAHD